MRIRSVQRPGCLASAGFVQGLTMALLEKIVIARLIGVGRAIATYTMPIEGRDEWLAAAARHFT